MKIPKEIEFLGHKIKIKYKKDLKGEDGRSVLGIYERDADLISLEKSVIRKTQEVTLLHEIVHVVDELMYIGLSEKHVAQLSEGLYGMITENKLFKK